MPTVRHTHDLVLNKAFLLTSIGLTRVSRTFSFSYPTHSALIGSVLYWLLGAGSERPVTKEKMSIVCGTILSGRPFSCVTKKQGFVHTEIKTPNDSRRYGFLLDDMAAKSVN